MKNKYYKNYYLFLIRIKIINNNNLFLSKKNIKKLFNLYPKEI